MAKSMTGFARAEIKADWGAITCELKSVNHRFQETYFRLPDSLREMEIDFRNLIKKSLARGKVDCSFQVQIIASQNENLTIDLDRAKQIIASCESLTNEIQNAAPLDALRVLQFPGVLDTTDVDKEELKSTATKALSTALKTLDEIRQREGIEMAAVVGKRVQGMRQQVVELNQLFPQIKEALGAKLKNRFEELKIEVDSERLEQELVVIAQKLDIDEEIDRLNTHLDEIDRVLKSKDPIGRRLDFLMQELNREANTVGSKSQSIQSTNASVEMKVLIEQMREQIQNIE